MKPLGKRILVKEAAEAESSPGGIIYAPSKRKELIAEGEVVDIPDKETLKEDLKIPVDIGDKVLYNRNTAVEVGDGLYTVQFDSLLVKY